ncbi:DUF697 domain-containing protein [Desulfobacterales bacterium HSG2]|nr:DUF697 domain-containing protein [Desulfobacterales bacterium HSG2]
MTTNDEVQVNEEETMTQKEREKKIVRNHVVASMAVGLIPIPLVDFVGVSGIQLNMLRSLAKAYGVPFSKDKGKNVISSLIGGGASLPLGVALASLVKVIPVIGQTTGALAMPVTAGAVTYAVGKVFIQHFASGGTFLTFDPEAVRAYYAEMLKEGEGVATGMK